MEYDAIKRRGKEKAEFNYLLKKYNLQEHYLKCCLCGWDEANVDLAHLIPHLEGGSCSFDNIVPLCPNHHRVYDRGLSREVHMEIFAEFLEDIARKLAAYKS